MANILHSNCRSIVAALAAIAVVGLSGLTLDQGHRGKLPRGVIEVGELHVEQVGNLAVAVLPAIEVIGSRDVQLADVEAAQVDGARG